MRSWLFPERATEATAQQILATGASGGLGLVDPVDNDVGFRKAGSAGRQIPGWTLEKARTYSVAAYRANPMARAIIDTYVAFCVGDTGLTLQVNHPAVRPIAEAFWNDSRNKVSRVAHQSLWLRDHLLMGESVNEMLVGETTGVTRYSVIDPSRIAGVELDRGNPLWPLRLTIRTPGGTDPAPLAIAQANELTGLLEGDVLFWTSFKALMTDQRGYPFLGPVLDDLDSYDRVISNLVDRTALARYLVWDVEIEGADQTEIDAWVQDRGGKRAPRSGTLEVHNEKVKWNAQTAKTGAGEDTQTAKSVLTNVAGGTGLAKTWLADPEDANRATSLTMAEPVRRRVGGVQDTWLDYQTELVQYAVDQAVAAGRLDAQLIEDGSGRRIRPSETVSVHGPAVAAADAQITAEVLVRLSQSLERMVGDGLISPEAATVAARKGWEQFVGVPFSPDLAGSDADPDDIATEIDDRRLRPAG